MLALSCFPQVPGGVWQLVNWHHERSLENYFKKELNGSRCMEKLLQSEKGLPVVNFIWKGECQFLWLLKCYKVQVFSNACAMLLFELCVVSEG